MLHFKKKKAEPKRPLGLYIHIPFCVQKCKYCDFLSAPADEAVKEAYIQALLLEIEAYRKTELSMRSVKSIFIGGGTPSVLDGDKIANVLDKIKDVLHEAKFASTISSFLHSVQPCCSITESQF